MVNDAATHVHEILEYQNTIELVKKYIDQHPDTIMISTSDHETGGLSLARQVTEGYPEYLWYPDVLVKIQSSTVNLAKKMRQANITRDFITNDILKEYLGLVDPTENEITYLLESSKSSQKSQDQYLADMVSKRAQLGVNYI
ncbi:hypothetical protein HPULCUR_002725 [Helicostylum pulchrum]|uniref:Alkaline phosphatase n=1 Tax=Helicostylum pulchrum TaxID=562976 RepID=A0ABP9XSE4_9FUNG